MGMPKHILAALIIFGLVLFAGPANASLINEGNYALDTSTGLDWLNPELLAGLSYQDVLAGQGASATYVGAGYRYATPSEFYDLMSSIVGKPNLTAGSFGGYYARSESYYRTALNAVFALGPVGPIPAVFNSPSRQSGSSQFVAITSQGYLMGNASGIPGFGAVTAVASDPYNNITGPYGRWFLNTQFNPYPGPVVGSFLVRPNPTIPEPSSLTLFATGLIGLASVARRKGRHA